MNPTDSPPDPQCSPGVDPLARRIVAFMQASDEDHEWPLEGEPEYSDDIAAYEVAESALSREIDWETLDYSAGEYHRARADLVRAARLAVVRKILAEGLGG